MTPDLIPLAAMLGISLILTVVLIWRGSHGRFRRPYDWEMSAFIGLCAALGSAGGLFVLAAGIDNDTMIFRDGRRILSPVGGAAASREITTIAPTTALPDKPHDRQSGHIR